jgi:nucleotide-binding universal stress UspA family protein
MEFVAALAAIIVIDLVLAGDNAIVIALAARNVPRHRRRQAIIWGTVAAIAVRKLQCDRIVMSTARKNSLTRMLEDSTTNKVLELTSVPVEVIVGGEVSSLERFGIPIGISALLALTFFAAAD